MRTRINHDVRVGRWHRLWRRMAMTRASGSIAVAVLSVLTGAAVAADPPPRRPNVVLVITDDQGYGDIAAHGNTAIKTPHMNKLHAQSIRLTDYHVDPTCSPTRSALMTGRYSTRTGVWHTINGRSLMRGGEMTMAEVFKANGYRTAMFGKWHLGDNAPMRPMDQGFDTAVWHHGGGVGQGPDYWGNDYFDDTYWRGDKPEKFTGYCTDVWFAEATAFIERSKDQPFFVYLATNAPHSPYLVADAYGDPYKKAGLGSPLAEFYGMITNIDDNLAKLRARLDALGLTDNTIFIFTTDNGSALGQKRTGGGKPQGFNVGMRGNKGEQWDGGHRVPFFIHWPAGKLTGGRDVDALAAHFDVLPTLIDLCGLTRPDGPPIDGVSLAPLLHGRADSLADRTLFVHVQREHVPPKWARSAVMTERWRLVDGKQLYDIRADPGQKTDVAADHGKVVAKLRADYETWWTSLQPAIQDTVRISLGGAENPVHLMSHDWLMPDGGVAAWHPNDVKAGRLANGAWAVHVEQAGDYEITLYRWPSHLKQAMSVTAAHVLIASVDAEVSVTTDATSARFKLALPAGPASLQTWLTRPDGKQHGAYFVEVRRVGAD